MKPVTKHRMFEVDMRKPLKDNQSGFSLTEAVVAALVLSILGLAIATSTTMGHKLGVEENRKVTASILKDRVQQVLESELAWEKTVAQAGNQFMQQCLDDISACPNAPRAVSMYDEFGDKVSDAANASFGYSHSLEPCNNFSQQGSDTCPYSVQVIFEGNPSIKLEAQVLYRPMVHRSLASETKGPPIYSEEITLPPKDFDQPGIELPKDEMMQMKSGGGSVSLGGGGDSLDRGGGGDSLDRGGGGSGKVPPKPIQVGTPVVVNPSKPVVQNSSPLNENLLRVKVVKSRTSKGVLYECTTQQELIDGVCRPKFYGQRCPANQALSGVDSNGNIICRPIIAQTCPEGQALVAYNASTGEITCQTQVGMCDNVIPPPTNYCRAFPEQVPVCFDRNNDGISDPVTECNYQQVYLVDGTAVGGATGAPTTTAPVNSLGQCDCPTGFTLNQTNPAQPYCEVRRNCPTTAVIDGETIRLFGPFIIEEAGSTPIIYCAGCKSPGEGFGGANVMYDKQKNWCYYFSTRSAGGSVSNFYAPNMTYENPNGMGYGPIPLFPSRREQDPARWANTPGAHLDHPGIPTCKPPSGSQNWIHFELTYNSIITLPANLSPNGYPQQVGRYFDGNEWGYSEFKLMSHTFVNRRATFYWCEGGQFVYSGGAPDNPGSGPGGNFGGGVGVGSPGSP